MPEHANSKFPDFRLRNRDAIENQIFGLANQDIQRSVANIQEEAQHHFQAVEFYRNAASTAHQAGMLASTAGQRGSWLQSQGTT